MRTKKLSRWTLALPALLVGGAVAFGVTARESVGSDHQQTALTELEPQIDITDTWVFPGSSDDRIVLAMTIASPLVGNQNARFDPNALYSIKIDNNTDGFEDVSIQFSFDLLADGSMTYDVIGPAATSTFNPFQGPCSGACGEAGVRDRFANVAPVIRRAALNATNVTGTLAASGAAQAGTIQAFAGLVDDPFYVDLPQFFRIIPDRRPTEGPLSKIGGVVPAPIGTVASAFRPACTNGQINPNQSQFDQRFGCAVDFLRGFNALAIVVELPESQLTRGRGGSDPELGIWATVSR